MTATVFWIKIKQKSGKFRLPNEFFLPAACGWLGTLQLERNHYTLADPTTIQDDKGNQGLQWLKHLHNFSYYTNNRTAVSLFVNREKTLNPDSKEMRCWVYQKWEPCFRDLLHCSHLVILQKVEHWFQMNLPPPFNKTWTLCALSLIFSKNVR